MLLHTDTPEFGRPAPDFDLATADGVRHTRDAVMGANGMLVAFICNHCPYVIDLIDRLAHDIETLRNDGIGCALVMSNDFATYPADAPDRMVEFTFKYGLTAPYLVDADQSVARAYGAVCTPDFFGYDKYGGLQYRGRLDDIGMRGDPGRRTPELVQAMQAVARSGTAPSHQNPSMGCSIKWR